MKTGAVIAAAGMSSRMGDFKPMLGMGAISISQRIIASLRQAGVEDIVVVTGHRAAELERHLAGSGAVFLRNESYASTQMFESAAIGLGYMAARCDAVLFTPVDIPLFTSATVRRLIESGAQYACPVCRGRRGHPVLLSSAVVERVLKDGGEGGLKGALSRCGAVERLVEVPDAGILFDADTPEDYAALLEYHNSRLARPVLQVELARELTFFDESSAMLLRLIDETNSVRAACARMQLSYSSGWNKIKALEGQLAARLVSRRQGGSGGGGSALTDEGRLLLARYEGYSSELRRLAGELFGEYFDGIL